MEAEDEDKDCVPPNNKNEKYIYIELTSSCNNSCPGCLNESFIADFDNRRVLPQFHKPVLRTSDWIKVLNRLPVKIGKLMLSGGEPTLYHDFFSLTSELQNNKYKFVVFSNGRWKNTDKLLPHLKNLTQFNGFLISLHGARDTSHDNFTGVMGSFDETVKNIKNATMAGLPVTISTVITSDNYTEIEQIILLAQSLDVKSVAFNRYCFTPKREELVGPDIHYPSPVQLRTAIKSVEHLRKNELPRLTYGPTIPQCFEPSASQGCAAGTGSFALDPWGNLKPCLHVDFTAGNITTQDFDQVWNNQVMQSWRAPVDEGCASCSALAQCGGGCRAMALAWGGKDPLMEHTFHPNVQLTVFDRVGSIKAQS